MDWRKILVAVDNTPTSEKALRYAGNIVGHLPEVSLYLLHIYPEPPPDYYRSGRTLDEYKRENERQAQEIFDKAAAVLNSCGIEDQAITSECLMAIQKTISQTILDIQVRGGYGTVVVGKRGVSKAEEFLFGSISNALVHHSKDIAIWVVG